MFAAMGVDAGAVTFVGLSLGSGPATFLANKFASRLISVVSADRGDDMLWESPAVATAKSQALKRGFDLHDFTRELDGLHPIQNLDGLGAGSTFVTSTADLYVPQPRSLALISAVRDAQPDARIVISREGHARTISNALRQLNDLAA